MKLDIKDLKKKSIYTPVRILALGFAIVIVIGAILLSLPIASQSGKITPFIDCIFTSTSAVCVTGLIVLDTGTYWTYFGKTVIMLLIEIGGLGFMSVATLVFLILGKRITLKERLVMQEAMNVNSLQGLVKMVRYVLIFTIYVQITGAVLFSTQFIPEFGIAKGIYYSVFHSVSAFCNAGFDLIGNFNSVTAYASNSVVILTIAALIIIGGLGFYVWVEIYNCKGTKRLSLHARIVIYSTIALVVLGAILMYIFEMNNADTMQGMSIKGKFLSSVFASVSPRTAGFNSIPLGKMTTAGKFLTIILMFIGGSPGSTAGGIKTTTAIVIFMTIVSVVRGREDTEIFQKRISKEFVYKAFAVSLISLTIVISVTMILSITQSPNIPFEYFLYEATSAFATVGLTLGLTTKLTFVGKVIILLTMYAGRVGPLTIILALAKNKKSKSGNIKYPEGKILIG
ncbi:TrkH family potassium uptake protein [Clostridium sp. CM028]|uniref:TrkH family potassium uptake protein n=1 Tax=unclassified Clostridium TaxID=2614128 RepID=UPI001C0C8854|nr:MULTISPECIES: TrkH family potassium uptake protein [unclassified Clostridium]MBU3092461.1 TrkH family potassium uptake protein [Clostridium sp. CF011]MBW9146951.1 TrkH family potassium uptake protein [Clostridium sp. CM027]MBW9148047.1 TrkH family potassium uptake protein [Clostridium sp. CM028]UVE40805.1 TrkH family potassium uptake protein [Clostridium sp. CM027]WAG69787.1 TrkH family potassium uptake protein [Clostridium sp. CF011]